MTLHARKLIKWIFYATTLSLTLGLLYVMVPLQGVSRTDYQYSICKQGIYNYEQSQLRGSFRDLWHLISTVRNWWLFTRHHLQKLTNIKRNASNAVYEKLTRYVLDHGSEYHNVIQAELMKLSNEEGRLEESAKLRHIIQSRIHALQNPSNCSSVPTLTLNLKNPSGFASAAHDVLWCFIKAFHEGKRLVLKTELWHYANSWEKAFLPITSCSTELTSNDTECPMANDNKSRGSLMRALPKDLGRRIINVQSDPLAWWHGQFLNYAMRLNERLQYALGQMQSRILLGNSNFVGLHVRRSDKVGTEAKYHQLAEYMQHAEEYFRGLEMHRGNSVHRRVFIATDDPAVSEECRTKFSSFECLHEGASAEQASRLETRYLNGSLELLLKDIFFLLEADFVVCTFSSGICRLVYELMHATGRHLVDSKAELLSLDAPHYYACITPLNMRARYNHWAKSTQELSFSKEDLFMEKDESSIFYETLAGKTTDGMLRKLHQKNHNKEGLIPIYKTEKIYEYADFYPR